MPEFARDKENCFLIAKAPDELSAVEKDHLENGSMMETLEQTVLPMYYNNTTEWLSIIKSAAAAVVPAFESGRMAREYEEKIYNS